MKKSLFNLFCEQVIDTSKKVYQEVYDCLYDWLDESPKGQKVKFTEEYKFPRNDRPQVDNSNPYLSPPPEGLVGPAGPAGTNCPELARGKPSIMRGYLCTSFDDGDSLGMALVAIAIDESHARQIMTKELQKYRLRLEPHDKLVEIDLHTPSVTLAMGDDLADNLNSWPDYQGW